MDEFDDDGGDDDDDNDDHDRDRDGDDDYDVDADNDDGNGNDSSDDDDPHTCDDVQGQGPYYDVTACATIEAASVLSRTHSNRSRCSWS